MRKETKASAKDSLEEVAQIPGQGLSKQEAIIRLVEGHNRYLDNRGLERTTGHTKRNLHEQGQYPFAAIIGCADSRVSPEIIFDQDLGDLFVVRVAGNIAGRSEIASIEYAIKHLGIKVLVVLGHERCGAVEAALNYTRNPEEADHLLDEISPAVDKAKLREGDLWKTAVIENVIQTLDLLKTRSQIVTDAINSDELHLLGAIYQLGKGDVEFVSPSSSNT